MAHVGGQLQAAVEPSSLTTGLTVGPQSGNSVGEANVFSTPNGSWCASITATNVLGGEGFVEAYGPTAHGLAIYEQEDFWSTFGPTAHLKQSGPDFESPVPVGSTNASGQVFFTVNNLFGPGTDTVLASFTSAGDVFSGNAANVTWSAITASGTAVSATEGSSVNAVVATVSRADAAASASPFAASINWGDGTAPTPGTVASAPGGAFNVSGTHTYPATGPLNQPSRCTSVTPAAVAPTPPRCSLCKT